MKKYIQRLESFKATAYADSVLQIVKKKGFENCEKALWIQLERGESLELNSLFEDALINYYNIAREAEKNHWAGLLAHTHISIARCYENIQRSTECLRQLNLARSIISEHQLDTVYATFCLRYSSYHRIYDNKDSAKIYALKSIELGHKFDVKRSVFDGHLLMGILSTNLDTSIFHFQKAVDLLYEKGDYQGAASQSLNIASKLIKNNRYNEATPVFGQAFYYLSLVKEKSKNYYSILSGIHDKKRSLYEKIGPLDSAYYHLKLSYKYEKEAKYQLNQETITTNAIEFAIEKEKEKATYLKKLSHLYLLGLTILAIFLMILAWAYFNISRKSRKILNQNEEINNINLKLKDSFAKQALLLSEIHHRVKNNLQIVISLMTLHGHHSKSTTIKSYLDDLSKKVFSIALIHEQLYQKKDFEKIEIMKYLHDLTTNFDILNNENAEIEFKTNSDYIMLNLETVMPIGIICSELIGNSLKHVKNVHEGIKISFSLKNRCSIYLLEYTDNGQGYPQEVIDGLKHGMGFTIINNMVRQLQGTSTFYNDSGAIFTLTFEEKKVSNV
jgi:two-component sensor histidine kinase